MQVAFLQSSTKSTHVEPFRRFVAPERLVLFKYHYRTAAAGPPYTMSIRVGKRQCKQRSSPLLINKTFITF